ncbi:cerebellar degeneration-related protein 2-like isoform X2 [Orussus abietinus]|uniref:cerebellar degeneration-related protein 2-like isoform X2 n=1 Tax=Orussus abietinus TaxID=222816 RepID=UPI00062596AC|nr:cerebellar degeneration-related protein 2-like isoform X2 [Orussus abietinus]
MNGDKYDLVWEPAAQLTSLDYWDYSMELACLQGSEDLQLAAELGKTLLERNKELENSLKLHQSTIDEQAQEIEYMKKQTTALREVNDSRLKIYEQLEVSIQDLERANHRLVVENAGDKKLIKSQCSTIENLEARCEELHKKVDEARDRYEALLHRQSGGQSSSGADSRATVRKGSTSRDGSTQQNAASTPPAPVPDVSGSSSARESSKSGANDEETTDLLRQLNEARSQRAREQKRVAELGEQLTTLLQENALLEEQLNVWRHKAQDMKSLQEEISTLEEVRQGHLCGRCLRGIDTKTHDELSVMLDQEEDDDVGLAESYTSLGPCDAESLSQEPAAGKEEVADNPYRVLVEKYEALLKVQRRPRSAAAPAGCLSLQEELEMSGEFDGFQPEAPPRDRLAGAARRQAGPRKPFSATPTDFSSETSSGFADETSNKATQTEGRPGSFLCTIADGEDCRFSIYDDTSSFESRFLKTPEYRQTFSEMLSVLKQAAEGDKVPPASARVGSDAGPGEDAPSEATDDNRSVVSSAVSSVVSEPLFRVHERAERRRDDRARAEDAATPRPLHGPRKPLEYLSVSVQVRKKASAKKAACKKPGPGQGERPTTPDVVPTTNPKVGHIKPSPGRRRFRPLAADAGVWNGNTLHVYPNRTKTSTPGPNRRQAAPESPGAAFEYRPGPASEEVAKLRRLEMSYAEALRMPNKPKSNSRRN